MTLLFSTVDPVEVTAEQFASWPPHLRTEFALLVREAGKLVETAAAMNLDARYLALAARGCTPFIRDFRDWDVAKEDVVAPHRPEYSRRARVKRGQNES